MDEDRPTGQPDDLDSTEAQHPPAGSQQRIGPYRILRLLGEGGMGVVYLAEQEAPFRRRVALKVVKWGMNTKQVVARFEAERQALALMDHPNVAKVFDAGSTQSGRPFFVMEYVKGIPITEHCDRQRLTTKERIELFGQVCAGVEHAHQKAIIHRDLKPSNILVAIAGGRAVPKIIDFGVAKATEHRLTERTLFTEQGQLIGTPEYMSPEQAEMTNQDIDTRTDVYALGALLYEILVGALPFEPRRLREAGLDEIRRVIREEEPPRPSTRLTTMGEASSESAEKRSTDVRTLAGLLRGDLDWIVMKALEKDRRRRYGSPAELKADLQRHLTLQPVLAGPPGSAYRARKFIRRHRVGVGVAVVSVLMLLAFALTMTVQARRIAAERDTSDRASAFLVDMLAGVDLQRLGAVLTSDLRGQIEGIQRRRGAPEAEVERSLASLAGVNGTNTALQLLDEGILARAGRTIVDKLAEDPKIAARLEHTLGVTYQNLGLYERAEPHARRAVEISARELGRDHPDTLISEQSLAGLYRKQGRLDDAEPLQLEVLETRKRVLGVSHPATLRSMSEMAVLYWEQGRGEQAETLFRSALEKQRSVLAERHPDTMRTLHGLAELYWSQKQYDDAEPLLLEVVNARRTQLGTDHPDTLRAINSLADLYYRRGRYEETEALDLEVLDSRRRRLGDEHPDTLDSMKDIAVLRREQGRYDEAQPLLLRVLEAQRRVLGEDHQDTINTLINVASVYWRMEREEDSRSTWKEVLLRRRRIAEAAAASADEKNAYAWHLLTIEPIDLRDPETALRFAIEANEMTAFSAWSYLHTLAHAYHLTGQAKQAVSTMQKALALLPEGSANRSEYEEDLPLFEAGLQQTGDAK